MIILRLSDGLGNQLFIYAFAKYLEKKHGHKIKFDVSWFNNRHKIDHDINYLEKFNLDYEIANSADMKYIVPMKLFNRDFWPFIIEKIPRLKNTISQITGGIYESPLNHRYITSGPFRNLTSEFDLSKNENYYFCGYWQSHEYANENRNKLINELIPPARVSKQTSSILNEIGLTNYVSVHFRRSDFGNTGNTSFAWFEYALNYMKIKYPKHKLAVFSNDIDWVNRNIDLPQSSIFFDHTNNDSAVEDLYAMTVCNHNIISASTFSWWGAFLNDNPQKTVIAPRYWGDIDISNTDKLPKSWILM